jgi:hypothetical protein
MRDVEPRYVAYAGQEMTLWAENVRFLLWRAKLNRPEWIGTAASWFGCTVARAARILDGREEPKAGEAQRLLEATEQDDQSFPFVRLAEGTERTILGENIRYLADALEHGHKQKMCASLGIHRSTLARWIAGTSKPSRSKQLVLLAYLSLPATTDLSEDPLFLSLDPVSSAERRDALRRSLDRLDDTTLNELYPALKRLLGE